MEKPVKIFVEGKGDRKFLEDYLKFLNLEYTKIINVGGWEQLHNQKNEFIENSNENGISLVIFDANGKPESRRVELNKNKSKYSIEFELFLLPNNHDPGALEDLLLKLTVEKHQLILHCFDNYQECIRENKDYHLPALKAKVYAYLEALSDKKYISEEKRDYRNTQLWNLNHSYLHPLKKFLEIGFSQK